MTSNGRYNSLHKLHSMSALRTAKKKLQRDIKRSRNMMEKEYDTAMSMFSYKNLICAVLNKVDDVQAMVRYARYGYDIVKEFRSRINGESCGCED